MEIIEHEGLGHYPLDNTKVVLHFALTIAHR